MTPTTLVTGASAVERESAIAATLRPGIDVALILEGLPTGITPLDSPPPSLKLQVARIAPGCVCCTGNLTMRVTLNRLLRRQPAHLYISLATADHLDRVRSFLTHPPYDHLLVLTKDLQA